MAESTDVDQAPVAVRLLGRDLVLWRSADNEVVCAPDRCPHREAPLSIGSVRDGQLTCAYHRWTFDSSGTCVDIPSSGPDTSTPPAAHLACHQAEEHYGLIWVCLGTATQPVPSISHENDPDFRRINTGVEAWSVSAPRMVDNFMDISHFPSVHAGTFGARQEPIVPALELGLLSDGFFGYSYGVEADNPESAAAASQSTEPVVHRQMSTGFHQPFLVRSTIRYPDGLEHVLLLCSTPADDETSLFTFVVWRNDDHRIDPASIISFDRAIGAEDKAMLEQIPGTLPLQRTGLVSVQADKPSIEWRRQFAEFVGFTGSAGAM